ncbi:MAG: hypothetical protein AMXMBFR7_26720 [Planctomycetota bacterium]
MILKYTLTAGETVEHLDADPSNPTDRARVLAAWRRLADLHPRERVELIGRLPSDAPKHIADVLNPILAEMSARREGGAA